MKRYLILNKEVFLVSYVVGADDEGDALEKWQDEQGEELDMEYLTDLSDYTKHAKPYVQEMVEV